MAKNRQITVVDRDFNWTASQDEVASVKFDLYVKSREIQQISDSLKQLMLMSVEERQTWLDENEGMVAELMDSFMDDSVLAMDGLQLDKESMDLSVKLVTEMRNAMDMIHRMLARNEVKSDS